MAASTAKLAKRLRRLVHAPAYYQDKRTDATDERWSLIRANLDPSARSLLDIGCNLGFLTRAAADAGLVAVGFDVDARAVAKAVRRNAGAPRVAFMTLAADPEEIGRLPDFDVVLCLSVHHYWVRAHGEAAGWSMVGTLLGKTKRTLFFEPASIKAKYRDDSLAFQDLDRPSIERYTLDNLQAQAGGRFAARLVAETECLGREPFRLLFACDRIASG